MTIQELLDQLELQEDKSKEVFIKLGERAVEPVVWISEETAIGTTLDDFNEPEKWDIAAEPEDLLTPGEQKEVFVLVSPNYLPD